MINVFNFDIKTLDRYYYKIWLIRVKKNPYNYLKSLQSGKICKCEYIKSKISDNSIKYKLPDFVKIYH